MLKTKYPFTIRLKEDLEERLEKVINERLESVRMIDKNPYALERTVLRLYYVRFAELGCGWKNRYFSTNNVPILRKGKERLAKIL